MKLLSEDGKCHGFPLFRLHCFYLKFVFCSSLGGNNFEGQGWSIHVSAGQYYEYTEMYHQIMTDYASDKD